MGKFIGFIITKIGTLGLALWIFWIGWAHLGPRLPEVGKARQGLAESAMLQVAEDIRTGRGGAREAALLPFAGDPSGYLTDTVRLTVEESGVLDLRDRTLMEKIRTGMNMRQPSCGVLSNAVARGARMGAPFVLFGRAERFESTGKGAWLDLTLTLADVAAEKPVMEKHYVFSTAKEKAAGSSSGMTESASVAGGGENMGTKTQVRRWLGWAVLVLALPIFTIGFIRGLVGKASNNVNAFTLATYTLLGTVLACLIARPSLSGWGGWLALLAAVLVSCLYNYRVMTYALKLETE